MNDLASTLLVTYEARMIFSERGQGFTFRHLTRPNLIHQCREPRGSATTYSGPRLDTTTVGPAVGRIMIVATLRVFEDGSESRVD